VKQHAGDKDNHLVANISCYGRFSTFMHSGPERWCTEEPDAAFHPATEPPRHHDGEPRPAVAAFKRQTSQIFICPNQLLIAERESSIDGIHRSFF